jgi:anaerobic magnesium-protoporphyrin IX monomethyl ester cyclase
LPDASLSSVGGLAYRDKVGVHSDNAFGEYVEDLDSLPFPIRDLLEENKHRYAVVMGSRGCKDSCGFCYAQAFWKRWRGRTIQNIVDEIKYLKKTYSVDRIVFEDNSLEDPDCDCSRLKELAHELICRKVNVLYDCNMRTEVYRKLDDSSTALLKRSGLSTIFLGIESGNDFDLRNVYSKKVTSDDNDKSSAFFKERKIPVYFGFINFNPYSTFENLRKNVEFLKMHGAACSFRHLYGRYRMYRGTTMFRKIVADGLFKEKSGEIGEELSYSFVDPRIEKMVHYLERYFQDALLSNYFQDVKGKNKNYFEGIQLLHRVWYSYILSHLNRFLENANLQNELDIIHGYKIQASEVFGELNSINANWFKNLLTYAETRWNDGEARTIIEDHLTPDYVRGIYLRLNKLKLSLKEELKRSGISAVQGMTQYIGYS